MFRKNITLSILVKYLHPSTRWSPNLDMVRLPLLGFAGIHSMYSNHAFLIDRSEQSFYTLKICVRRQAPDQETAISTHLKNANDHFGKKISSFSVGFFWSYWSSWKACVPGLWATRNEIHWVPKFASRQQISKDLVQRYPAFFDSIGFHPWKQCYLYWQVHKQA